MLGSIYKIIPNGIQEFYIGSTFNFNERKGRHKLAVMSNGKKWKYKLYATIRECGGEFEMIKLYDVEVENDLELCMEERRCYDKMSPTLNMNRPYITEEEALQYRKTYQANYKKDPANADKYERYKITKRNNWHDYYIKHKDAIKIKTQENNHKYIDRKHNYYKKNAGVRVTCICGTECVSAALARHMTSKKHHKLLKNKDSDNTVNIII